MALRFVSRCKDASIVEWLVLNLSLLGFVLSTSLG
jgi:hypothetical protein